MMSNNHKKFSIRFTKPLMLSSSVCCIAFATFVLYRFVPQKQRDGILFYNATIYRFNPSAEKVNAFVVQSGKIAMLGTKEALLKEYNVDEKIDLQGKHVYPGFNDAHAHFYNLGKSLFSVDLTGTRSWDEVVQRCVAFYDNNKPQYIIGRGWDQNDWEVKAYPTNARLNMLFPNIAVLLVRVDGHAVIANNYLLEKASFNPHLTIAGGELIVKDQQLTGVLIDNAADKIKSFLPPISRKEKIKYLLAAEKKCFSYGITSLTSAGMSPTMIHLIDSLQQANKLKIRIYAMIAGTLRWVKKYIDKPFIKTDRLSVRSFKLYADGALGSRGAYLTSPYTDSPNHIGLLIHSKSELEQIVNLVSSSNYQLNTHCIGDGGNKIMLELYGKYLKKGNNRRWRIEHAQVINPNEYHWFEEYNIIPSVQPTHATSDMYWAEKRLGKKRLQYAYAYKSLLAHAKRVPLGTDFPVETPNPFFTFYAAVARMDSTHFPEGGFNPTEALSRKETLQGMTLWPAYAAFEEEEKGSLERGKFADFVVLDADLMKADLDTIRRATVVATYCNGEKVFEHGQ